MLRSRYHAAAAPRGRWVIAHRGASARFPENTLPAFRAAVEVGADFIELDVHLTADDEVVVVHDGTLGRTISGAGRVAELTLAELRRRDAGSWKSAEFAGARVPTLAEVLDGIPLPVMVEIKPEGRRVVERTVEVIRAAGAAGRVVIASFSDANLRDAEVLLPEVERLALGKPDPARMDRIHIAGPPFDRADAALAERMHRGGGALWCWTVDDPADIAAAIRLGADGIISNHADRVVGAIQGMS